MASAATLIKKKKKKEKNSNSYVYCCCAFAVFFSPVPLLLPHVIVVIAMVPLHLVTPTCLTASFICFKQQQSEYA